MADESARSPNGGERAASFLARLARFAYHLARDRRVPWQTKAAVVFLGAYIVSPYDLIPDWIPVAGALDDLLLIPIVMNYVFATVPEEVLLEHWGEDIEALRPIGGFGRRRARAPRPTHGAPAPQP